MIVDDEELARDSIKILLESRPECQVIGECENGQDALLKIKSEKPDIVFMDIQMPKMQGLEVIQLVDESVAPIFIMVTAYDEYALKAFDLNAIDYLLKPYSNERFFKSLEKAISRVASRKSTKELTILKQVLKGFNLDTNQYKGRLVIKSASKIQLVNKNEIIYVKASGNYSEIHTLAKKHLMYASISEIEGQLDPTLFVRIHRSAIVNKENIKELESHFNGEYIIHLDNGEQLKLSRSYRNRLESIIGH